MITSYTAYRDGGRTADGTKSIEAAAALREGNDFVWLSLNDPTPTEIADTARCFGLHELAVEDAEHAHQRPKIEEYGESLFVVLRNAHYDRRHRRITLGEIHLFLGDDYVIGVRHGGDHDDLDQIRERVDRRPELLKQGPSAIVYAAMDQVVDDYGPVVEELSNDIERIENEVFDRDATGRIGATTESIYELRREVVELHRALSPLVLALERVRGGLIPHVPAEVRAYFRDVLDHLQRASDQVDGFRELLGSALEANVALVSVRQNEIVQKISGWAAIIAVPTLISSIYGMNFKHMPELNTYWGYPAALTLMVLLAFGMYGILKKVDWL